MLKQVPTDATRILPKIRMLKQIVMVLESKQRWNDSEVTN